MVFCAQLWPLLFSFGAVPFALAPPFALAFQFLRACIPKLHSSSPLLLLALFESASVARIFCVLRSARAFWSFTFALAFGNLLSERDVQRSTCCSYIFSFALFGLAVGALSFTPLRRSIFSGLHMGALFAHVLGLQLFESSQLVPSRI